MSAKSAKSLVAVVRADDLRRTLRLSRSAAYELLRRAGAVRVGERAVRLPVARLVRLLGADLAQSVIEGAAAHVSVGGR